MIVIERVDEIQVYANHAGGITIQQDVDGEEVLIAFPAKFASLLIDAIGQVADEIEAEASADA